MLRPIVRRPQGVQLFTVCVTLIALANHHAIAGRQNSTMTRLFAPVDIEVDISRLSDSEHRALSHIIAAARVMDSIFLQQVWAGNPSMLLSLLDDETAAGAARLDFFLLNKGPWSRIENDQAFVRDTPQKQASANFYPTNATKEEIETWFKQLEGQAQTEAI